MQQQLLPEVEVTGGRIAGLELCGQVRFTRSGAVTVRSIEREPRSLGAVRSGSGNK